MSDLPPIPTLTLNPPQINPNSYDLYFIRRQVLLLNGEQEFYSSKEEIEKKYQHKYQQTEQNSKQIEYDQNLSLVNITRYQNCKRCDRWVFDYDFKIHLTAHAAIVEPNLLLGDRICSQSPVQIIQRMKVTHIVNAAWELNNFLEKENEQLKYLKLQLYDNLTEDLIPELERAVSFIKQAHQENGIVFVHCAMGKSRSVSAILLYLLREKGISIDEGLAKIRMVRKLAKPNINYMKQLYSYEQKWKQKQV